MDLLGVPSRIGRSKVDLQRTRATQPNDNTGGDGTFQKRFDKRCQELWCIIESLYTTMKQADTQSLAECRFACIELLFEVHLDQPPFFIPLLDPQHLGSHLILKHFRWSSENSYARLKDGPVHMPAREVWTRLRSEIRQDGDTLDQLSDLLSSHSTSFTEGQQNELRSIEKRTERRLKMLRSVSTDVTDYLTMTSADKSTEMAE